MDRRRLIAALIAGTFILGTVGAMAADEDSPAYRMGMASQRQHDLQAQATNNPPTTVAESKALQDAAVKARAAYASLSPEEKALYKKAMKAQREMDLFAQQAQQDLPPQQAQNPVIRRGPSPAIDMQPLSSLNTAQTQVARARARERWESMTPEEQAEAKQAAAAKTQEKLTALDELATLK